MASNIVIGGGEPTSILAIILVAAGTLMGIGSLALVANGTIKLNEVSRNEAIGIEFYKYFRLNTQIPGVALFLMSITFVGLGLWAQNVYTQHIIIVQKQKDIPNVFITGKIVGKDGDLESQIYEPIKITITPYPATTLSNEDGFQASIDPDSKKYIISFLADSYQPKQVTIDIGKDSYKELDKVVLLKSRVISAEQGRTIVPLPAELGEIDAQNSIESQPNFGAAIPSVGVGPPSELER